MERRNNRVFLRNISYDIVAGRTTASIDLRKVPV